MPESRDRLVRPVDIGAVFTQRRLEVLAGAQGSPVQTTAFATATRGPMGSGSLRRGGGGLGRGSFGTPGAGNGRGRNLYGSPVGRENTPARNARRGRGRVNNSGLPSWYPRTPLRDITSIVRAIERRRASLREVEGRQIESPIAHERRVLDDSVARSGVQLDHNSSMVSPIQSFGVNLSTPSVSKVVSKVPKILLDVTKQTAGESEFLTPQKKLLNSIDAVGKVVMEELQNLKRTPTARKAEREKRIRTLMSMR